MANDSVAFDRAAGYYDNTRGFPPGVEREIGALMAKAGNLSSASRVLEIGVGTGRIALPVAPLVGRYYGIDLARPMMDRLRAKQHQERIYLTQGDVTRLPFADASFDAVIAVHVFHLIPAWREVLSEVERVLRPDAPLLHGGNGRMLVSTLQDIWNQATHESREAEGAIPHAERETFLAANGWRETGLTQVHSFTTQRSPQDFINSMRGRYFSSTWVMSDEVLERGVAAVQAYIDSHYDDPTQPEVLESNFKVQAYLPPKS
ncbi:MAG: methyltransferase domain-containing protein [Chloroflexi bacterium]|nr:methyltransferase domain-containing protein [Chloroflexota bacterium]